MKVILDSIALILFFAVYFITHNIYTATIVAVVAGIIQAGIIFWKFKKLETMQLVSLLTIIFFGGATIILRNEMFIKWKPTVLFWFVASAMLIGILSKKNFLQKAIGKEISLPENVWYKLMWIWTIFFFILGLANLFVAYTYSNDVWVTYKVFGVMGILFVFFIAQSVYMAQHLQQNESQEKQLDK
ncbi:MAG: septation protein A [Neisseriaceae bacterium]|nr:septation protein A [Neisseriaceae bacterium]